MKLSDAIRAGAKLRPQVTHAFFRDGESCALAAGIEAAGYPLKEKMTSLEIADILFKEFPFTVDYGKPVSCPNCSHKLPYMGIVIEHLNDVHFLTREQIADWVETVEPKGE